MGPLRAIGRAMVLTTVVATFFAPGARGQEDIDEALHAVETRYNMGGCSTALESLQPALGSHPGDVRVLEWAVRLYACSERFRDLRDALAKYDAAGGASTAFAEERRIAAFPPFAYAVYLDGEKIAAGVAAGKKSPTLDTSIELPNGAGIIQLAGPLPGFDRADRWATAPWRVPLDSHRHPAVAHFETFRVSRKKATSVVAGSIALAAVGVASAVASGMFVDRAYQAARQAGAITDVAEGPQYLEFRNQYRVAVGVSAGAAVLSGLAFSASIALPLGPGKDAIRRTREARTTWEAALAAPVLPADLVVP